MITEVRINNAVIHNVRNLRRMFCASFLFGGLLVILGRLSVLHKQMDQKNQKHRCGNCRGYQQRLDAKSLVGNVNDGFCLGGFDSDAAHQKPVGIDAIGGTGEQSAVIAAVDDLQIRNIGGLDDFDKIKL